MADEKRYQRSILKRIVATVKCLASRGLALRGKDDILGSPHKGKSFLVVLKILAEFDDLLSAHIAKY
jgi:hypothetical protein